MTACCVENVDMEMAL